MIFKLTTLSRVDLQRLWLGKEPGSQWATASLYATSFWAHDLADA